jgi:hypothetical protein
MPVQTSYSRRRGDYAYDVVIRSVSQSPSAGVFCARVMNLVRLDSGETVSVDALIEDEHAATPAEALSRLEAAVEDWVTWQTSD